MAEVRERARERFTMRELSPRNSMVLDGASMQTRSDVREVATQTECDETAPDVPLYQYQAEVELRCKAEGQRDWWRGQAGRRRFDSVIRVTRTAGDGRKEGAKHIQTYSSTVWINLDISRHPRRADCGFKREYRFAG